MRHSSLGQGRAQRLERAPHRLDHERRAPVVVAEQRLGPLIAVAGEPALDQPLRMRVAGGEVSLGFPLVGAPGEPAQHRVHEAGALAGAAALGCLDGGLDGGVARHARELQQLVRADAEQVLCLIRCALPAARHERSEARVQLRAAAQHAGGDLVCQPAIGVVEPSGCFVECGFELPAAAHQGEGLEGGAAGVAAGGHPQSSIPVVGLDGTAISRRGMRPAR